jgi:thioredoxin reductase (NADPH)
MTRKPVILAVDDEPTLLAVTARDVQREFGANYQIVGATSGGEALETLTQFKLRNEAVALLLVDQGMPHMTGVEFLQQARHLYPDAKRVLLTVPADGDVLTLTMRTAVPDDYLHKPWDAPEEQLYPILKDLLADWQLTYSPPSEGLRVIGHRWASNTYRVRDLLARNQVRYQWLDLDTSEEARHLLAALGSVTPRLPVVLFPDGSWLADPTPIEAAEHFGLRTQARLPFYDLIIVGAGPAGLGAAVYGASEGLRTLLIEREAPGGQAGMSSKIENYLGFPAGLSGAELTRRALMQVARFGAELLLPHEVTGISVEGSTRLVHLADGATICGQTILLATGVSYRTLDVPGSERLQGAGIYYGAGLSEAPLYRDQDVYLVGGANAAGQAAMYFVRYARSVTLLVRGPSLEESMSQYLIHEIAGTPRITVKTSTLVVEATGESNLEAITISQTETGETQVLPTTALFVFIGATPQTDWVADVVERDEHGYILSGLDLIRHGHRPAVWTLERDPFMLETSVPGVFVAGDTRLHSMKRVASAVGAGAMSVQLVQAYLRGLLLEQALSDAAALLPLRL